MPGETDLPNYKNEHDSVKDAGNRGKMHSGPENSHRGKNQSIIIIIIIIIIVVFVIIIIIISLFS